jgi:hypothetical protein
VKIIERRLRKLEDRFGPADGKPGILLVVCNAGWGLALDQDTCIHILHECGFLPTGTIGVVNLCEIPEGLNAKETEGFLRANGAEICGRSAPTKRESVAGFSAAGVVPLKSWPTSAAPNRNPM